MLINPWHFHPPYVAAMCPRCSEVHTAVPLAVALRDCPSRSDLVRYYECTGCRFSTSHFVYAEPDDAPPGFVGPMVVLGFAPDMPVSNGEKRTLYFETAPKNGLELLALIELYFARAPDFYPLRFRLYGIDVDEEIVMEVLSAAAPLSAAKALANRYINCFD